jgi:hypothetical protein
MQPKGPQNPTTGQPTAAEFRPVDPSERLDLLKKVIERYDFYINATNTKASIVIGWNAVLLGTFLFKYDSIVSLFPPGWSRYVCVSLLCFIGLFSVLSNGLVFNVIFPFVEPGAGAGNGGSILFFGSVCKMGSQTYFSRISSSSSEVLLADLADQAVTLACGLKNKMEMLRRSIFCIYWELAVVVLLLLLKTVVTCT